MHKLSAATMLTVVLAGPAGVAAQVPEWRLSRSPVLTIGELDGREAYLFKSVAGGRLLRDGRILVADRGFLDFRVYDQRGTLRARFGGRGRGPREFLHIGGFWFAGTDTIAVWDAENQRVTLFDSDGAYLRTVRVTGSPGGGNVEIAYGPVGRNEFILASLSFGPVSREAVPDQWALARFDLGGAFRGDAGTIRGMWRADRVPIPFSPIPHAIILRDSLYVADGYEPEITIRDARGATVRTIRVPQARNVSAAAIWSALEARLHEERKHLFIEYLEKEQVPRDSRFPTIGGLLADEDGNLWVKSYDPLSDAIWLKPNALAPASGGEWRVIRPDGRIVATVRMPNNVRPLHVRSNRLLGVAVDELGVERIVVHTILR